MERRQQGARFRLQDFAGQNTRWRFVLVFGRLRQVKRQKAKVIDPREKIKGKMVAGGGRLRQGRSQNVKGKMWAFVSRAIQKGAVGHVKLEARTGRIGCRVRSWSRFTKNVKRPCDDQGFARNCPRQIH